MASIIHAAAAKMNADTAGLTHAPAQGGPPPGLPSAPTPTELAANLVHDTHGGLSFLFGGHPENLLPVPVATSTEKATDSLRTLSGGWKPRSSSTVAPGPAGAVATVRTTVAKGWRRLTGAI